MKHTFGQMAATLALTVSGALALGGCSGSDTSAPAKADSGNLPQGSEESQLDPADFSTTIDNPYLPMKPGTRFTYHETDSEGGKSTVVVTVTSGTKVMANGVTARVVRDTATEGGTIVEDTNDWFAQDKDGNVWYLGEATSTFIHGAVRSRSGSFEAGAGGAQPGIAMPARPKVGMSYRQEYRKGEAEDAGEVLSIREMAESPYGAFKKVLLTRETTKLEPDALEYKLYAPGVGQVLAVDVSGGSAREELISVTQVADGAGLGPLGEPDA